MPERLFFALWPPEAQRRALAEAQKRLPPRRGKLIHPRDLHITLVFLGDLDPQLRRCAEAAAGLIRATPFALRLDRIGSFPRAGITWCGASQRPQALLDLVRALNRGLLGCGFRPERRPYSPHVTLARKARPLPAREMERPVTWPVSDFGLVIALPDERPRYRLERRWPLVS